jgi:hypothetical protein
MNVAFKLLIPVLLLVSIGVVVGDHLNHIVDLSLSISSNQIDKCSTDDRLSSAANLASDEKVFVGSVKSNKYHYPDCVWAKKILPENEIRFTSSQDARAHGYVPCKVCNPP